MVARVWRSRGPVATAGRCQLLAVDESGPIMVRAWRTKDRGVKYDGVLYPDELLKQIGDDCYMLAGKVQMPADGDISHNAPFEPLRDVSQLEWTASWESYDRARRRLNADALWERGGAMSGAIRNILMCMVFCVTLFAAIAGMRTSSAASDLAREASDLRGAIYKVIEPAPLGAPTGDVRPTQTPVKKP